MRAHIFFPLLFAFANATAAPVDDTLCKKSEAVFFSCPIQGSNKIVSLCGDKRMLTWNTDVAEDDPYLAYRFGKIGNIEMEFPKERKGSIRKFKNTHDFSYADVGNFDIREISFNVSSFEYRLFDKALPSDEGSTKNTFSSGILVSKKQGNPVEFLCAGRPISNLWKLEPYLLY